MLRRRKFKDVLTAKSMFLQEFGSKWMSIERKPIFTVRVINECYHVHWGNQGDL